MIRSGNRTRALSWLAFALVVATIVAIFQTHHSYFFEVTLVSSHAETARIYYGSVDGNKTSAPFQHSPGSPIYRLPIATGTAAWLQFAPLTDVGTATFSNARIVDRKGRVLLELRPRDFRPHEQVARCDVTGDQVTIESVPHALEPLLDVSLPGPLRLEKLDFDLLLVVTRALPPFLIVLLGGLIAGIVPGLYTPRSINAGANDKAVEKQNPSPFHLRHRTALLLAAAAGILFLRMPDRFLNSQFWAEDGYFFMQALENGTGSLFMPYGGYQLLVPRIAEFVATKLPLEHVPLFLNLAALTIALTVISRVLSPRCPLRFKPLLALALVLVPRPEDIFLSIENIQWVMSLGVILLAISANPGTFLEYLYDCLAAVICGLTGVFSILFLPLFGLRLWQRRDIFSTILFVLILTTAATQAWFVGHAPQLYAENAGAVDVGLIPGVIGYQLFLRLFGGEWVPNFSLLGLTLLGMATMSYFCVLFLCRGKGLADRLAKNILLLAFGIALAASIYRFKYVLIIFTTPEHIARYFFPTQMLFIWILLEETTAGLARRVIAYILLLAFLATSISLFRVEPLWNYHWQKSVEQIRRGENVSVPINPPGWYFQHTGKPN